MVTEGRLGPVTKYTPAKQLQEKTYKTIKNYYSSLLTIFQNKEKKPTIVCCLPRYKDDTTLGEKCIQELQKDADKKGYTLIDPECIYARRSHITQRKILIIC